MLKLLIITLLSFQALAETSLKLSGKGLARFASGREYPCTEVFLDLKIYEKALVLNQGGYICGFLQASFDSYKMDIRQGKLWHDDQELGRITEREISYQIYDPSDNSTYYFQLKKENSTYSYFEEWHDGEEIALKVIGKLHPYAATNEELLTR